MKKEKKKIETAELPEIIDEQLTDSSTAPKKKKKNKLVVETPAVETKAKKSKSEKSEKKVVVPEEQKAPKEDKITQFLVSMKKSVRKSIKKEAAEAGVSMNGYIVIAVEEKLGRDTSDSSR